MRLGIRTKVVAITIAILLLAIGVNSLISSRIFRREYSAALQSRALVIGRSLKAQVQGLLQGGRGAEDIQGFEEQCKAVLREHRGVAYAMILRRDGKILFHNDPSRHGTVVTAPPILSALATGRETTCFCGPSGDAYHNIIVPVRSRKGEGDLAAVVGFPVEIIDGKVRSLMSYSFAVASASFCVAAILLLASLSASVTAPLSKLLAAIQGIRDGQDAGRTVAVRSKDEVGQLASAFNAMVHSIRARDAEIEQTLRKLREARDELESRVLARTIDLTSANRELQREVRQRAEAEAELRRAKEALEEANASLERRVTERTAELVKTNEQLRQAQVELVQAEKMGMLGQLVAGVAHEINTPTGAILNVMADARDHLRTLLLAGGKVSELSPKAARWLLRACSRMLGASPPHTEADARALRRRIEHDLRAQGCDAARRLAAVISTCFGENWQGEPHLREHLNQETVVTVLEHVSALKAATEISLAGGQKIARIVRALRYYSHSGQDKLADIDVNESLDNTLVILQNRLQHAAEVRTDFCDDLPAVRGGARLSQVWTNILNNACDAIGDSRRSAPGLIEIVTRLDGDHVVVEISNNGEPIPEKLMTRIYDPFFTTKPVGRGTGLGLSICTGILRGCGGTLAAENRPGRVTFTVVLPVAGSGRRLPAEAHATGDV